MTFIKKFVTNTEDFGTILANKNQKELFTVIWKNANSFVLSYLYLEGIGPIFQPSHRLKSTLVVSIIIHINPKRRRDNDNSGKVRFYLVFRG